MQHRGLWITTALVALALAEHVPARLAEHRNEADGQERAPGASW